MKEDSKFVKLADELNKLYGFIKKGGDFSFDSDNQEIVNARMFVDENYARLNVGILGFLVELLKKHSDCDFEFVPAEDGVSINFSYKVQNQVCFDENGLVIEQGSKIKEESLSERTNN